MPRFVALVAVLMAAGSAGRLVDRFKWARAVVMSMFPTRRRPGKTVQGFNAALAKQSPELLEQIVPALRQAVVDRAGAHWRTEGFVLIGVDGSRFECPMTLANENAFGTAGKDKTGPQQFITTAFHAGTGLVWDWRRGEARASERAHLQSMLDTFPQGAMVLADAGFTGYELMRQIIGGGRRFLIRVGANVTLLRKLGWVCEAHDGIVHLWPDKIQRQKKQPPLTLRLITLRDARNRTMHLLTDVLDPAELTDAQASRIYSLRWNVELCYRSIKQTMDHRKMLSDSPEGARLELDWAMVAFWLIGLMLASRQMRRKKGPAAWSAAAGLHALRAACDAAAAGRRGPQLEKTLAAAHLDTYQRTGEKKSRHWPHKKRDSPPGQPKARNATAAEIALAAEFSDERVAA